MKTKWGAEKPPPNMDIPVFEVDGTQFDESELQIQELPPVPEWFQEQLNEIGGYCGDKPNLRIVSGLDPEIQEFFGGKWWRKYAFRIHDNMQYFIWRRSGEKDRILTPKEAQVISNSKKKEGILIPKVDERVIEFGIPRYFLEFYKPPHKFGDPDEWEKERWLMDETEGLIELMPPFPHEGDYETWFCIEEPVLENNKVVKTKFKELDEIVLEFIRFEVDKVKAQKTLAQAHIDNLKEGYEEKTKSLKPIKEEIKDRIKDRIDRIKETPKTSVPSNYGDSN